MDRRIRIHDSLETIMGPKVQQVLQGMMVQQGPSSSSTKQAEGMKGKVRDDMAGGQPATAGDNNDYMAQQ